MKDSAEIRVIAIVKLRHMVHRYVHGDDLLIIDSDLFTSIHLQI